MSRFPRTSKSSTRRWFTISCYRRTSWSRRPTFMLFMIGITTIIIFSSLRSLFISRTKFTICLSKTLTLWCLWSFSSFLIRRPIKTKISIRSNLIMFYNMFWLLYSNFVYFFYLFKKRNFQWRNHHNSFPTCSCPSCSSDSMDITFGIQRYIKIDNESNIFHVKSSRSDIGRHKYLCFS